MFKTIIMFFKALNTNTNPGEIAHAAACGLVLGLIPKNNLLWYLVFIFILFIRINKPAYLLILLLGTVIAPHFDVFFDFIGYAVLSFSPAAVFFGTLLEVPFAAFTRFNNTIVMGSFITGIILYLPVYFFSRGFIALWRRTIAPAIAGSKLVKSFYRLPFIVKISSLVRKI